VRHEHPPIDLEAPGARRGRLVRGSTATPVRVEPPWPPRAAELTRLLLARLAFSQVKTRTRWSSSPPPWRTQSAPGARSCLRGPSSPCRRKVPRLRDPTPPPSPEPWPRPSACPPPRSCGRRRVEDRRLHPPSTLRDVSRCEHCCASGMARGSSAAEPGGRGAVLRAGETAVTAGYAFRGRGIQSFRGEPGAAAS
jgi:hypothetical protein